MQDLEGNTSAMQSASAIKTGTQEVTQTQQWHPFCMVRVEDTVVVRIPATFSKDVPMSRPARWHAISPSGSFSVRWGPDPQNPAQTIITQGWNDLCAANDITPGNVVILELLGVCRRLVRISVKEEREERTSQSSLQTPGSGTGSTSCLYVA
ncbi:hypothetical protein PIB30_085122 [Stylosanthes scabra]|uniref:TF-B3 domain-containing protein n=1 Tax=Stylosanthes scabra TaxID=79078 RepID=A0ABU6QS96_9FABA|nr:hypothetical protein [Stylosanthes scabra]